MKETKSHIAKISKASTYFIFRNGPIKEMYKEGKISDEEIKNIQCYMENHLAYLYDVLLEENNINKFQLIMDTMDKFYINDAEEVKIDDEGFENFYNQLFPSDTIKSNIKIGK
ncbi:hypothetical protein [Clostridium chauvoei]|uniref:Uncharacterized protein n=3 Tax=Clostridium chauvoei TaxID=46867 RepID=S6EKM3_9CLOT|nr:hypothetical protein [Clostridium chauvoei]ATD55115.1 hypothetical protein BTM20_07625 [Clostridium chauvoei]ATD57212.1 hypothetical protein BTM21_05430 [Clostridium chauvoei]MBX7279460.1 hypothetical protein [Clostridium chauvoei]MBX7282454.1 hypothetical protein [Clostridium chauvoei]MBX7285659.1 hypothetical protein [Clostridium chauvoei]